MNKESEFFERRILTGLIVSTEYLDHIRPSWDSLLLSGAPARRIADWCVAYYDKYNEAPNRQIENVFLKETKRLDADSAEEIEMILLSISDDYERADKFNVPYLIDQTRDFILESSLRQLTDDVVSDLERGDLDQARSLIESYSPTAVNARESNTIDLSHNIDHEIESAFNTTSTPIFKYPYQLGEYLNEFLVRDSFVSVMAPEKRGKTWFMMDAAIRAAKQGANVALFQAGDMTTAQQLKRICIHLTGKSDQEKYSGKMYEPVRDCIYNQIDNCNRDERESVCGIFEGEDIEFIREKVTKREILDKFNDEAYNDYSPCHNCKEYWSNEWGAVWYKEVDTGAPLTVDEAKKAISKFFPESKRRMKISSFPTKTLKVSAIDKMLDVWERQDGFVADLILIDYADILDFDDAGDFRNQENGKWMRMRALSQKRHALVISPTQTDASSYKMDTLGLQNFSEDKRKYAHVTAMFGLNQDVSGREKELGILRINTIIVREGELNRKQVHVLQNLKRGQFLVASYF